MAKVLVANHLTLDGVMQSPARSDEETRGGFAHGGWAIPRPERVAGRAAFLLGRRTYEDFYSVWPNQPDDPFCS